MPSIYELSNIYKKIESSVDDPEVFKDTLDSLDFTNEFNDKVQNTLRVRSNIKGNNEAIDAEIKRLQELKKHNTNAINAIDTRLIFAMATTGKDKVETPLYKVAIRHNKRVDVTDLDKVPQRFKVEKKTVSPNKKAIKESIKAGFDVEGAEIITNNTLSIK